MTSRFSASTVAFVLGVLALGHGTAARAAEVSSVEWKTYVNGKHHYKVSYPPDWEVRPITASPSEDAVRVTKFVTNHGAHLYDIGVGILVEPNPSKDVPTKAWYEAWVRNIPDEPREGQRSLSATTFRGFPALAVDDQEIFVARGEQMFHFAWYVAGSTDEALKASAQETCERILATFEFLE